LPALPVQKVQILTPEELLGLLQFFCSDAVQRERLVELASVEGRVDLHNYCHKVYLA
jgi:hypothetical protein